MVRTPHSISDYDVLFDPIRQRRQQVSGKPFGDPDKAARAMLQVIESDAPPGHLLPGAMPWPWFVRRPPACWKSLRGGNPLPVQPMVDGVSRRHDRRRDPLTSYLPVGRLTPLP